MTDVSWSTCGGADCIRVSGLAPSLEVLVRPAGAVADGEVPAMAGRMALDGDDLCFVPRFGFLSGTPYMVTIPGEAAVILRRPWTGGAPVSEVLDIRPSAAQVPLNLLRFYISFSAPMSEGCAARNVLLVDEDGAEMAGALLPMEQELWDGDRRRLTVLLDPARIKRGLPGHRSLGYPIRSGQSFRLVVDDGFRDAGGNGLARPAGRRYVVGGVERRRVEPGSWNLSSPAAGATDPLDVRFDRPLDHGLLRRCLRVAGPDGRFVEGTQEIGWEERSWRLAPLRPWAHGSHQLVVDPVLEDLAGNSVSRVFDQDLNQPQDRPRPPTPVLVTFRTAT